MTKLTYVFLGILVAGTTIYLGCKQVPKDDFKVFNAAETVNGIGNKVDKNAQNLEDSTKVIKTNAKEGMDKTSNNKTSENNLLFTYFNTIFNTASNQDVMVAELKEAKKELDEAEKKATKNESALVKIHQELVDAQDETKRAISQKYTSYSGILFFGMIISAVLAVANGGNRLFMATGVVCAIGCAAALFVVQTFQYIPYVMLGIGAIVGIAWLIRIFHSHKTEQTLKTATKELSATIEAQKPMMTVAGRRKIFGDGPIPGVANILQSPTTQKIVSEIRDNLDHLAPPIPVTVAVDYNNDGVIDEKDQEYSDNLTAGMADSDIVDEYGVISKPSKSRKKAGLRHHPVILH